MLRFFVYYYVASKPALPIMYRRATNDEQHGQYYVGTEADKPEPLDFIFIGNAINDVMMTQQENECSFNVVPVD